MVNVIGLGYIGLPTALMLAANGVKVTGSDYNNELVDKLNKNELTFEEKGLEALFEEAIKKGITFKKSYIETDTYIISVPTPYDKKSKRIKADYVVEAVKSILEVCPESATLIIESTVSPGTIDKFIRPLCEVSHKKVNLVHAPERIIPGNMIFELVNNSRTIGADHSEITEKVKKLYKSFCRGEIVTTDIKTAEMTKVVENTFRDINIAYANELAKICRSDQMDVHEIIRIANKHPRVNILSPGPGVGGHCISVDPWFLVGDYPELANLILAARRINDSMPEFVIERIHQLMVENGITDVGKVGLYGLTYKEDVDDTRESPTLQLLDCMEKHLASGIKVYDPYIIKDIVPCQYHDFNSFIDEVDLIVIMVAHSEIRQQMDLIQHKVIFDTRRICLTEGVYYL